MKPSIILAAFVACFAFVNAKAQTINGVKLADIKEEYIEFSTFKQTLGEKTFIWLEYGQKTINNRQNVIVKDESGKNLECNSAIDFMNKMKDYGYELFQAYAVNSGENASTPRYILKRKS